MTRLAPTRTSVAALLLVFTAIFAVSAAQAGAPAKADQPVNTDPATSRAGDRSSTATPRIRFAAPARGAKVAGTVSVAILVRRGVVTSIDFAVDGAQVSTDSEAPFAVSIDTTVLANGRHTVSAAATGPAGITSATAKLVVANPVPVIAPSSESAPSVSGKAQVGQTLAAATGDWAGTLPFRTSVSWLRCDGDGAGCAAIDGAGAAAYRLVADDEGSTLRARVTVANDAGETSVVSAPTPAIAPAPVAAPRKIYWGAWVGSHLTGNEAPWDMNAAASLETSAGKGLGLINFSSPFAACWSTPCTYYAFPKGAFDQIRGHGSIPFFSWASDALPVTLNQPDFQLSDLVDGRHDDYIRAWATAAKNWGHPFFLRFNWEMNGAWFPWSEGVNGNKSGEFVASWRHVHDIFASVGATNATWVWCPNIDPDRRFKSYASQYPGDAYVDWTCLDGYNAGNPWRSFDSLFRTSYEQLLAVAPSKPVAIGELGSTEKGGSKADWISDALGVQIPTSYPAVKAALYFDKFDSGMDWPIETSPAATAAFASALADPAYARNDFAELGGTKILPLA